MNIRSALQGVCRSRVARALAAVLVGAGLSTAAPKTEPVDPDHAAKMARGLDLFTKQVKNLLDQRCLKCHGGKRVEGEFDLVDRAGLLKGGTSGPAILPGRAKDSLLYKLVMHAKEPKMPHNAARLPDREIAALVAWIDLGAPYDAPLLKARAQGPSWTAKVVTPEAKQFWSFQPLRKVEPPAVKDPAWCQTLLDRFILAKLEAGHLSPNPAAAKRQLIRRASFDLTGLPPAPEEVNTFLADAAPEAYERLIDRLLASPRYGERWGRHWLDLARFAESHGFEHDYDRPTAYHYRDFVIEALNNDLPFDTFVKWQLAGDEIAPDNLLALKATGFLAAGVHSTQITKNEVEKHRYDEMDDMLATVTTSMLGLTLGCARCHDHKFDPFPQRDYYRMLASFTTTVRTEIDLDIDPAGYKKAKAAFDQEHAPFTAALAKFETEQLPARYADWEKKNAGKPTAAAVPPPVAAALKLPAEKRSAPQKTAVLQWYRTLDPDWKKLNDQEKLHAAKEPKLPKALISSEGLKAVRLHTQGDDFLKETHFLKRGDPNLKEGVAVQSFLQVLMPAVDAEKRWQTPPPAGWRTSYRRKALADWLTDVDHGAGRLLARVIVNRLWQHHMGRGIVGTPSDFGNRGELPTHPELLDWLANQLIQNGWKLKPIHKLMMTSAVYRQTAQLDAAKARADLDNKLYWRRPRTRLQAEVVRDALLAVGGTLDTKMYGPGTLDPNSRRRSIYFTVKRSQLVSMMTVFDAPDALAGVGDRPTTTIAPQALLLMNNPQVRASARGFARRVSPDSKTTLEDAVKAGYLIALTRAPDAEELADSVAFVKQQMESYKATGKGDGREQALADFCQALLCLNEFVYVE